MFGESTLVFLELCWLCFGTSFKRTVVSLSFTHSNDFFPQENNQGPARTIKLDPKDDGLPLRDDACFEGEGVLDMTKLNYLHEAAILFNLRTRFFSARPYTYTGDICIAVRYT